MLLIEFLDDANNSSVLDVDRSVMENDILLVVKVYDVVMMKYDVLRLEEK